MAGISSAEVDCDTGFHRLSVYSSKKKKNAVGEETLLAMALGDTGHHMTTVTGVRSVVRWAGSKRQLIPNLKTRVPVQFKTYVEPFAGSACLFFNLQPTRAILGDINAELMQTYRQLRRHPTRLYQAVATIPISPENYYQLRSKRSDDLSAFERAVRFLYLNRNCFNAVYRVNKRGEFNVPFGTRTGALPSLDEFRMCGRLLKSADILTADFEEVIELAGSGDFLYLDPPYTKSVADEPGLFGAGAFDRRDLARLVAATKRAARRGVTFLLSFEYDELLMKELSHVSMTEISAHRHVSGFSGARGRVSELLFTNWTGAKNGR